jgi:membrane associated rhomboid family serine protease
MKKGGEKLLGAKVPAITYLLIAVNALIFFYMFRLSESALIEVIGKYGLTPNLIMERKNLYTLVTSMFLHFDFIHLFSNMIFLLIAGDSCERAMGHSRFLAFYLIVGVFSGLFYVYMNPVSNMTAIGASGAVFGVLAAFAILFPFRMVISFVGFIPIPLPAIIFVLLSVWLETYYVTTGMNPHIAHTAHIGGFLAGVFLTLLFGPSKYETEDT